MEEIEILRSENQDRLATLENRLGYRFNNQVFLLEALIHRSFNFERPKTFDHDNEKLEFLGDAVVDLAVGHLLFRKYPDLREGDLSRLRASLVNETHLAALACEMELGSYLFLGKGEDTTGGRDKPSILSSVFEAVVGAIYLDGGFDQANLFLERAMSTSLRSRPEEMLKGDFKSRLQESLQERYSEAPTYVLEKEEGPDHDKLFTVSVLFRGNVLATAIARSKKEAEQRAASQALQEFEHQQF